MKIIICLDSGTILDYDRVAVVEYDELSYADKRTIDDGYADAEIIEVAERHGRRLDR